MTTLNKAIKNENLLTWPSTEDLNFKTLIDTTEEHLKGHLDKERKNLQSTKIHLLEDFFPNKDKINTKWHKVNTNILDNEFWGDLKFALENADIKYQLVPPGQHCRNAAERAIRTFKNHFLACLATYYPSYSICELNRLVPQVELTPNLL